MLHLVSVHAHFVTSNNGFETVLLAETLCDVWAELHTNTSLAGAAAFFVLGISPEHFHHQAGLAWLSLSVSVQLSNVVQGDAVIREETAVEDQVLVTDQRCQR